MSKTYVGAPCAKCACVIRYSSNGNCRDCLHARNRAYQARNRADLLPKKRAWAKANPEKNRAQSARWQAENAAKAYAAQQAAKKAKWNEHYKLKGREYASARRAAELRQMPPWVDRKALLRIYADCPDGMEVDHAVPLQGRTVSGLHVPWNLQYLPASENARKGNRHHD